MRRYILALLIKQGSQNVIGSALEATKRAMESAVLILVSGIIIAGVVLYSLIQLCKQLEIFILQSYESGESILAVIYGVVVIAGLVALFLLSSRSRLKGAKNSRVPIKHEPLEGIISGFVNGFYSGLKGEPTSHI